MNSLIYSLHLVSTFFTILLGKGVINPDILPQLDLVLEELNMTDRIPNFVQIGITETRLLFELKKMDFQLMLMEWENFSEDDAIKLKQKIDSLITLATIPEKIIRPELKERLLLKYGRIYIADFVQSFEFISASYGGSIPIGKLLITIANPSTACIPLVNGDLTGHLVFVTRGECSFFDKTKIVQASNASVIAVINNEDRLEAISSGLGMNENITDEMVLAFSNISVISMSNTTLAPIQFAVTQSKTPIFANVIPLKCGRSSLCQALLEEEQTLLPEISCGKIKIKSNKEIRAFDFLTSNFGGLLPKSEIRVAMPENSNLNACLPLTKSYNGEKPTALLVYRGNCTFDVKANHTEASGAVLMIVVDMSDPALQRLGGKKPIAGYVGIPSITVTADCGAFIIKSLESQTDNSREINTLPLLVTALLEPHTNSQLADRWIDLAYTQWTEDEKDQLTQLEGLTQTYTGNKEIIAWLRRKSDEIKAKQFKAIDTDELLAG